MKSPAKKVWIASAFALRASADSQPGVACAASVDGSSRSLSSGARSRDPLAPRNDDVASFPSPSCHRLVILLAEARYSVGRENWMLTEAEVLAHADRIRNDGYTVIPQAASATLVDGLRRALDRIEREH